MKSILSTLILFTVAACGSHPESLKPFQTESDVSAKIVDESVLKSNGCAFNFDEVDVIACSAPRSSAQAYDQRIAFLNYYRQQPSREVLAAQNQVTKISLIRKGEAADRYSDFELLSVYPFATFNVEDGLTRRFYLLLFRLARSEDVVVEFNRSTATFNVSGQIHRLKSSLSDVESLRDDLVRSQISADDQILFISVLNHLLTISRDS